MDLSAALARDLALLSDAIDEGTAHGARVDLVDSLGRAVRAARAAVSSYVGLSVTTGPADTDLRFTVIDDGVDPQEVRASLRVPFRPTSHGGPAPVVIFFASTPGAFVDLAADIAWLTGRPPSELALDADLTVARDPDGVGTVAARSAVDQAVGVLLAHGRTPEQARAELARRASDDHGDLERAAAQVIVELVPRPGDPSLAAAADGTGDGSVNGTGDGTGDGGIDGGIDGGPDGASRP